MQPSSLRLSRPPPILQFIWNFPLFFLSFSSSPLQASPPPISGQPPSDPAGHPSIHPFRGCSQTPGCRGKNPGNRRPSLEKSTGGSRWAPDLENPASTATDLPKGEVGRRICKQTRKKKSRTQETKAENINHKTKRATKGATKPTGHKEPSEQGARSRLHHA
ncbi:hypothetical protein SLEP1_g22803 [Rubroshorea leprosula]|uniref:Uncharacterized protein n=1 Tax=Rubroshorea leprosula TaxID=152421 RepID=A0AAV5JHL8_9ROSI|nr:hypothetical protein SLEP1_g22803 [Rubroshorea leprosula]